MLFRSWLRKTLINYTGIKWDSFEVLVIVFAKSLNVLQQLRHNIEQDMAAVDVMCSE